MVLHTQPTWNILFPVNPLMAMSNHPSLSSLTNLLNGNKTSSCCFSSPCMGKMSPKIPFPLKYLMSSHDYPAVLESALWEGSQCPPTSPPPSTECLFSTALPQKVLSSKQQELLSSPAPVCAKKPALTCLMKVICLKSSLAITLFRLIKLERKQTFISHFVSVIKV